MIADALTGLRLMLAFPFGYLLMRGDLNGTPVAIAIFIVAIVTDLLDGYYARKHGTESALGRLLDHGTDFLFVTFGLAGAASRGVVPGWLPVLITVAFVQYVVDSYWLGRERELRMSGLGRWNGILYFVPLGGVMLTDLGLKSLAGPTLWVAYALSVTTILSIGDRLLALDRSRH